MADKSENPQDNVNLNRLGRDLANVKDDLAAELRQAQDLTHQAEADRQRASKDRQVAKGEAAARGRRAPRPLGAAAEGNPVAEIEAQSRAVNAQVTAEERLARATRERARATADAAETVRRARANEYLQNVPGYTGPAAGQPAPIPAWLEQRHAAQAAAEVQARVQAAEAAARHQYAAPIGPQPRGQANQYPVPIGPQPRGQANQFPKPIGPLSPQAVQQAGRAAALLAESEDAALQAAIRQVPAAHALAGALSEQARALGLADNAYTRHGYLTSEFISAAARGEVTFKELGNQVGGTIAKFAGWTAAATSVYAVVGAMGALYHGALTAASGVGLVNRVVTQDHPLPGGNDALQQGFRDLSRKFNAPMEDVVQSVYGAAKATGGDLPAALKVAEQALFGVKVGELSAADSTRYLQAIMRGFGASASELPAIFDAINQAQNRFGGSTGDMVAGVAKAAGIFKLAGGDYRQLIALITTGTRLTGATGTEVATAISRSAGRVLTPQGADALRGVGINPNQKYGAILAEASRKAQAGTPQDVYAIARALVPQGGQYARILGPILQNRELYAKVFGALDPKNAKGSAERELRKALQQPDEQLKRLLVDLERLGSTLAQSGGLNLLVGLVKLLDEGLNATVKLVDAFNSFTPGPLRAVLTPLLELSLIMKGLRRFDVGASLPVGQQGSAYSRFREGLSSTPAQRANKQITQGLGDEARFLEEERRRAAMSSARATYQAERSAIRRDAAQTHFEAQTPGTQAREEAAKRLRATDSVYLSRLADSERLTADQIDYAQRTVVVQKQIADYERLRKEGLEAEAAAAKAGILFTNPTLNRPVPLQPVPIGGGQSITPGGVIVPGAFGTGAPFLPPPQPTSPRTTGRAASLGRAAGGLLRDEQVALTLAAARASKVGDAVAKTAGAAEVGIKTATGAIGAGIGGLGRLGGVALHGLDSAMLAIPAAIAIWSTVNQQIKTNEQELARLQDIGGGPGGIDARVQQYHDQNDRSLGATLRHPIHAFGLGVKGLSSDLSKVGNALIPFGSPLYDTRATEEQAAKDAEDFAKSLREAQKKNALLYIPQVQENFKRALANAQTPKEIQDALEGGLRQIDHGFAKTFGDRNAKVVADRVKADLIEQTTALAAARGSLDEAAKHVTDLNTLKGFTTGVQTSFGLSGPNASNLKGAGFGIAFAREQIGRDPTQAAAALQQLNTLQSAVQTEVSSTLSRLLAVTKSPAQAGQVRAQAVDQLRTGLTSQLQARSTQLASSIAATQNAITQAQLEVAGGDKGAKGRLAALQARLKGRQNRFTQVQEGLKQEGDVVAQFQAEQERAQFQLEQGVYDATTARRAGAMHNPVQALRFQLQRARARLGDVAKQYGTQSAEYQNALTQEQQLQDQIVQAEISRIQSSAQLRAAQTANPIIQAQITLDATNRAIAELARRGRKQSDQYQQLLIQKAQQQQQLVQAQISSFQSAQGLNRARANIGADQGAQLRGALADAKSFATFIQSQGDKVSPDQINQALTAVASAQGALVDYAEAQAKAMIQARGELGKSQTTDPIKQAVIDLRTAQANVKFATTPAERVSALAAVNNAKRNVHDVKLQNAESDIDFEREMNRIGVQTAIARYRALLADKENSKAQRQDILRKIKGLQTGGGDSSFNIDPNSIRLPTPYEVFRAIKEGANSQQRANLRGAVQNTNHIVITVANQADVQKVADVFDQYLDTSAASSLRAMGVA